MEAGIVETGNGKRTVDEGPGTDGGHQGPVSIRGQCKGCGQLSDLKVLDREYAFCVLCGTTNTWMVLEVDDDGKVAVTGRKER